MTTVTMSHWPARALTPLLGTTVGGVLRAAAWRAPDRIALIDPGRREWTYGELRDEAERVARGLLTRFEPGEPVAVWAGNGPDWVLLEFAAGLAGLTLVTVNPAYQAEELAHVLGHSGAAGVFLRSGAQAGILAQVRDRLPRLREVLTLGEWPAGDGPLPEVDPASPAQILYTSGTTGRPKAAVLTHRGLTNNARLAAEAIGLRAGDVMVNPMPYFHVAGCALITLGLVQTLGTHVVLARFDPGRMLELTERYRGTVIGGVPTMLTALLAAAARAPRDLSSLRLALAGGATVPCGTVGEICTRGYLVMDGYLGDPEATAAAIDADGWLHTGDLGTMDARGYVRVTGRVKEMIIRGGENIYPRELEELLFRHPKVGEVAVVGLPDQKWGEEVGAFIRPAPGATISKDELFLYMREHLAPHKTPRQWFMVEAFPLTGSGKIQKFKLRESFVKGELTAL